VAREQAGAGVDPGTQPGRQDERRGADRAVLPAGEGTVNPIEPKWAHGKKAVVEPERLLSADEVRTRVCEYYGCDHLEPLGQLSA